MTRLRAIVLYQDANQTKGSDADADRHEVHVGVNAHLVGEGAHRLTRSIDQRRDDEGDPQTAHAGL